MSRILPTSPTVPRQAGKISLVQRYFPWFYPFWKFSRPHTIIGTSLSVVGLYLTTLAMSGQSPGMAGSDWGAIALTILLPLAACLCGNVYIVGLNQLEDVAIDQINKPHLPLASGEYSRRQAIGIVAIAGVLAILLALLAGPYLLGMVGISLLIGTVYSLPPIRLKRFPFWASVCIFTVRGVVVNLGLFLHFHQGFPIPLAVWALTLFVLVFTFAIAIFKDMPDIEGDRRYNITTFTLRLGQRAVFNLALWVLTVCYGGMILAAIGGLPQVNVPFLVITHLLAVGMLWWRSSQIDLHSKVSISRVYQFIWKLFFLEYLVFPAACWLRFFA